MEPPGRFLRRDPLSLRWVIPTTTSTALYGTASSPSSGGLGVTKVSVWSLAREPWFSN
ncbi:hypothetical protein ACRAWF_06130 [Streptomyces sp. L7]